MARKSRGRQKLAMTKIENESSRLVTFSKRRSGIFKKASELATLCGSDVAVVVFSPGQRVFSFGHPSVEHIVDRFYSGHQQAIQPPVSATTQLIESRRNTMHQELNFELTQVLDYLEMAKKRGVELDDIAEANRDKTLIDTPMEKLDTPQLLQLKASLELLKARIENQAHIKAQAHAMATAHYAQTQAQAEHQLQQQRQLQQLYINPAALPPPPAAAAPNQPPVQLAAENNNNNMNNNGASSSVNHLEFLAATAINQSPVYMNPTAPPAAAAAPVQPQLQLAAENSNNNMNNNGASSSTNHLEFYHRLMKNGGGVMQITDDFSTVGNGNVAVSGSGAFQEYRRI